MKFYKYVLWDWNGTLLDDLQMNIDLADAMLGARKLPPIPSKEFYLENFGFPIVDFYALAGFDLENEDFGLVSREYAEQYQKLLPTVGLFADVTEVLELIRENGAKQTVISATEHSLLKKQVDFFGIGGYFEKILGTSNTMGQSKVGTALAFLDESGISPDETVFIGDTLHDCETAEAIGCDCILVSRGHNSKRRLLETGMPVFDSLKDAVLSFLPEKQV